MSQSLATVHTIPTKIESPTTHVMRAGRNIFDFLQIVAKVRAEHAQTTGLQYGVSAVMAIFVLVWLEVGLYFALATKMASYWAAFLTLTLNLLLMVAVNLYASASKKRLARQWHPEEKIEDARTELEIAKMDLVSAKEEIVERTNQIIQERVVVPFHKYKKPAAVAGSFVAGLMLAQVFSLNRDYNDDVFSKELRD